MKNRKKNLHQNAERLAASLRNSAKQVAAVMAAAALFLSLLLFFAAVYAASYWVPGAVLCVAAAVILDGLLIIFARSRYYQLMGQAVCTEASAFMLDEMETEEWRKKMMLEKMAVSHPSMIAEVGLEELQHYSDQNPEAKAPQHRRRRLEIIHGDREN